MKIVISTSPHIKHASVLESDFQPADNLMYSFAPLGILMLSSCIIKEFGIMPSIFDLNRNINTSHINTDHTFYSSCAKLILASNPNVVGFMTECDSYHHLLQVCSEIKKISPQCFIVLGGPHATAVALPTMNKWSCIDCIVLGEGEITFVELIGQLNSGNEGIVPGTIMRDKQGTVCVGDKRQLLENLDDLPFPAYELYEPNIGEELFLEVGRGCPFQCTFCSTSPFWERRHRVKSPRRIVEEMKYLKLLHNCKRVHFTHDLFTANQVWVANVCNEIIDADLGMNWTCSSRVDTISEPLIKLMSEAGCNAIFFGIESGSDRILEEIEKKIYFKETVAIIEICQKYGITPNAGMIVGFPTEDELSFNQTFEAYFKLLKSGIKPLHLFSYCPFVQSSIYESLTDLTFTGNFLDIPLPLELIKTNFDLIRNDQELFGSFYKPSLEHKIKGLTDEMISGIDEFALLVDAVRLPSILIAEQGKGMQNLFFEWIKYIATKNTSRSSHAYRKYFGSSIDYCEFLLALNREHQSDFQSFNESLLRIVATNFQIANQSHEIFPISMANYRTKVVDKNLLKVKLNSQISTINILDYIQIEYDVSQYLDCIDVPLEVPKKQITNYAWQKGVDGQVSLIQLNDFVYYLIDSLQTTTLNVQQLIDDWLKHSNVDESVNLVDIFEDLKSAQERNIIKITG